MAVLLFVASAYYGAHAEQLKSAKTATLGYITL
jgi:hypothetical protein